MKVVIEPLKSRIGLHSSAAQTQASQKLVAVFDRSPVLVCTVFVGRRKKGYQLPVTSYQLTTSGK